MIDADRRFLVTFTHFLRTELAVGNVVIRDEARPTIVVLVEIEPRFLRVDDDGVLLVRLRLQEVARNVVGGRRTVSIGLKSHDRFVAQIAQFLPRCVARVAERRIGLLRASQQQII